MSRVTDLEFGSLPTTVRKTLVSVFQNFLPNLRFGPVDTAKSENFAAYHLTSTTATSTSEFSVLHGMGTTPYRLMPVIDLSQVGAKLVPLTVTRAADAMRIYVKTDAGSTNTVFSVLVE